MRPYARLTIMLLFTLPPAAAGESTLRTRIRSIMEMLNQNQWSDAGRACTDAMTTARDPKALPFEQAMLLAACGHVAVGGGDAAKGQALLEQALVLFREDRGPTDPQVAATSLDLARLNRVAGRCEISEQQARAALEIGEVTYGRNHNSLIEALVSLGLTEMCLGRYAQAETHLTRAHALIPSTPEIEEANVIFSSLGLLCYRQGRYVESERWYLKAVASGRNSMTTARSLARLGSLYVETGRYGKAESVCARALDLMVASLGPKHSEIAAVLQTMGQLRRYQQRHAESVDLLRQALDIVTSQPDANHQSEAIIRNSLAVSLTVEGRFAEAESNFRAAIAVLESLGADGRRDLSVTLHGLALNFQRQGRYGEALELASRAYALREPELPNIDASLLEIIQQRAGLLRKARRKAEAASLERMAQQAKAERSAEDPQRWTVDLRDLSRGK